MKRRHAAGTIVAHNYVAQARVLARSFMEHHPSASFFTLVVDGDEEDRALPGLGTVVLPEDLAIGADLVDVMRAMYAVMEYSTALKPAFLLHLHRLGVRSASYIDPDVRFYAPIDDVFETAAAAGVLLTPHTLHPVPRDGLRPSEATIALSGIYNLGFIATGPASIRFLGWWHERLKTDAIVDHANALFTDQRWIDWAPALESPVILKDPGLNAAYWNVHERPIRRTVDGTWWAGSVPLRFFHFSGYDPARPLTFSKHLGNEPRTLLSENPDLNALCGAYGAELLACGHAALMREPYRNDTLPDGTTLTPLSRALYRAGYLSTDPMSPCPPNPFSQPDGFRAWLSEPFKGGVGPRIGRYEHAIWQDRPYPRAEFPRPLGADAARFRRWLAEDPQTRVELSRAGVTPPVQTLAHGEMTDHPWGWSVAGYARAELGIGEAGRRMALAVAATGLPWEMVGITQGTSSRQRHRFWGDLKDSPSYANALICVNADQTLHANHLLGLTGTGRRIGYWFWELEEFPDGFDSTFAIMDEIWVSSEFTRKAIQAKTDKPVRLVPLPLTVPARPTLLTRRDLDLPEDKAVFLTVFDFFSFLERKNPLGVIDAYCRAFGPDDGAMLVVKSINGHRNPMDRERVRAAIVGRPDIVLREDYLTGFEVRSLIELSDVLVSLHRSEGFGLNIADAMAVGTPTVATAYSGNLEFMTDDVSRLIDYKLSEVGPGSGPYMPTAVWANPSIDGAARAMRDLFDRPDDARAMAARARAHIGQFSVAAVAAVATPLLASSLATGTLEGVAS